MEKGNLKLAEYSVQSKITTASLLANINSFWYPTKWLSFKLNKLTFPRSFSTASKPVSSVPASLSFATACSSSSYVSAISHKYLCDPENVCDGAISSSNVYPSKPIRPSKPACFSSVRPSKPIISKSFYLHKPVYPRNISSSRPIRSSNACQSRSNVNPSKPFRLCKPVRKPVYQPVCPSNIIPNKPVRPSNASLSKTTRQSKFIPVKLFVLVIFVQLNLFA